MMSTQSILAGKTYETSAGEVRQVKTCDGAEVVFTTASGSHGVGMIGRSAPRRLPLATFAEEAQNEVTFDGP
jgi:hypothetical protein